MLKKFIRKSIYYPCNLQFKDGEVLSRESSDTFLKNLLCGKDPFFVGRMGASELNVCRNTYYINRHILRDYEGYVRRDIKVLSGVFPNTNDFLRRFTRIMRRSVRHLTAAAVWRWVPFERFFYKRNAKHTLFLDWYSLFPGLNCWTKALEGKRVLVVSPFCDTFAKQYRRRQYLFQDPGLCPEMDLVMYKPVVSFSGSSDFADWEEALMRMYREISKLDFDVALLSCGAYGIALGSLLFRRMQKKVIHVGGSLQLLFGVKGRGFIENPNTKDLVNSFWVFPSLDETPESANEVENALYWDPLVAGKTCKSH